MKQDISKICADSLRAFAKEKYDIKLKATHAHELVAAYFGYSSNNAMLADKKYSISNLDRSEIVVMAPDEEIDQRRKNLEGLSDQLPDSYILGEAVYQALFASENWTSPYPPFRNFKMLAKVLVENSDSFKTAFKFYRDVPMHHVVIVKVLESEVLLTIFHTLENPASDALVHGETTINLSRVAGHIGYGKAKVLSVIWTGAVRRTLGSLGVLL